MVRFLDIHSHILAGVDDGSQNLEESLKLLEMMKNQGITDVVATPHFDASKDCLEDYLEKINNAYHELKNAAYGLNLPEIYLGSEVFYFGGIGKSHAIKSLCMCDSSYLLLELPSCRIDNAILNDILALDDSIGITPIIAHIERYYKERGFKDLLKIVDSGAAYAQINASSVTNPKHRREVFNLIKHGYISFVATDTHSVKTRPPVIKEALTEISAKFGSKYRNLYFSNSQKLFEQLMNESPDETVIL